MDCWKTRADPSKLVEMVGGSTRSATCLTCAVAAPSDTPGLRPNDIDTDGSWPESMRFLDQELRDVPERVKRKVTHDNAAKLYGLK